MGVTSDADSGVFGPRLICFGELEEVGGGPLRCVNGRRVLVLVVVAVVV